MSIKKQDGAHEPECKHICQSTVYRKRHSRLDYLFHTPVRCWTSCAEESTTKAACAGDFTTKLRLRRETKETMALSQNLEKKHLKMITVHGIQRNPQLRLWDTLKGHSCETLLWDTVAGHSCGTLLRDTLVGHSCGILL